MKTRRFFKRSLPLTTLLLLLVGASSLAACSSAASQTGPSLMPEATIADGWTPVPGDAQTSAPAGLVDNADPGFSILSGDWGECWGSDCGGTPYGESFLFADSECDDCQALFAVLVTEAGDYDVWTWWPAGEDRATDTPVTISYRDGDYELELDQRNSGDGWFWLAQLPFDGGPARITIGSAGSGFANADAVALTPAGTGEPGAYSEPVAQAPTTAPDEPDTPAPPVPTRPPVAAGGTVVIDWSMSDISQIPPEWIERAKQLTVHYAHTSHGSQIVTGLEWLAAQDSRYAAVVRYCGSDLGLPGESGVLRLCDGNPPDDYVTPELYWSEAEGLNRTRAAASTGMFDFSMWSWCGQQSENDRSTVQQYLDTLDRLEQEYPAMRFIYMTGHTDGGSDELARNNDMVREYAQANGKVLFDFASFEMYDPAGNYYPDASDACDWCDAWCSDHPDDCRNLGQIEDCAHTHPLQCKLKAQAFWWMMAVLAGWDGQP
jgi:hypothetical protein